MNIFHVDIEVHKTLFRQKQMNVQGIPVKMMELALMELMSTLAPVLLPTLEPTVKQVS